MLQDSEGRGEFKYFELSVQGNGQRWHLKGPTKENLTFGHLGQNEEGTQQYRVEKA